jgi:glutathione synthase/RimK-type ligase-like ATP-grasp enzyme
MAGPILILTQEFDPIADRLVVELSRRGAACVRWHPDSLVSDATLSVSVDRGGAKASISWRGRTIEIDEIRSVWNRRPAPFRFPRRISGKERMFAEQELKSALAGMLQLGDAFWINHPDRNRRASLKALQLEVARRIGLEVPRTLITNDPAQVRDFVAALGCRQVVYKTLHSPFLPDSPLACFTSILSAEHLDKLDLIRHTAGIFQEYVPKRFEIRVTIIGHRVFATEIHSQEVEDTRIDWRRADTHKLRHSPHELPDDIEARCRTLTAEFGLIYAAMDLIFTPDGRYVFLENNPAGQYGWIEDLTGAPMTSSLAEVLIAGGALW